MTRHRFSSLLVVILFAAAIATPAAQQATDLLPRVDVVDNRPLAPFPPVAPDAAAIVAFPARFDAWYADHMGLRGTLVSAYRWLTDALLGSPDKVIIGRDDWLYLRKGVREDIETVPLLRDWCGRFNFPDRQLEDWVAEISANRKWLADRGIDYLFVVPPNKMTVIPGHLPERIQCRRGTTRLEQLTRALAERAGVELVDLRGRLKRAAASGRPIWYRTDTHWNARGVAAAYAVLADRIRGLRPGARVIDGFEVERRGYRLGDLGRMLGGAEVRPDVHWSVHPATRRSRPAPTPFPDQADAYGRRSSARVIEGAQLPSAMVFHDSFFDGPMNEFLAESFSRSVFVFHGRPGIDREMVKREQPDIVIHEMVERNLLHPFFVR